MKKLLIVIIILAVLIVIGFTLRFIIGGDEDSWIKDSKGEWIKHGNPASIPAEVREQQDAVTCAQDLYQQAKDSGTHFSSQCLGNCGDYAVDIINVPRNAEDNKIENQCSDFREDRVSRFIELDKDGNLIRIN